ncbi:hypothetical protein EDD11_005924 [Mortierella claussenii]|nr:hypothetical protein EDD11_005924 [Mortierella claussenii]
MTNHPENLDIFESGGPPVGALFSLGPDKDDLLAMVATMQDISAFGIAGRIWDSSYILNAFLHGSSDQHTFTPPCPIPHKYFLSSLSTTGENDAIRILELGAGTGYVGIALAKRLCPSATLVLTDLEEVMPLLEKNVRNNVHGRIANDDWTSAPLSSTSTSSTPVSERQQAYAKIVVEPLEWGNSSHAAKILTQGRIDYIVASDLVYFPELYPPLLQTLREIADMETRVIFGYKDRAQWKEMPFWEQFGRFFEIEVVRIEETKSTTAYDPEQDEDNNEDRANIFGSEEDVFVFVAKKRRDEDILVGVDDTLTTLMMMQIGC